MIQVRYILNATLLYFVSNEYSLCPVDGIPKVYLTFAISATDPSSSTAFKKMKEYIKAIINRYDPLKFKYSVVVFGQTARTEIKYNPDTSKEDLIKALDGIKPIVEEPSLVNVLKHTGELFKDPVFSEDIPKDVILMWNKNSSENAVDITTVARNLTSQRIRVIPVPMINNPTSAADAANPSGEKIIPNDVSSDSADIAEQMVDIVLSGIYI